MTKSSSSRTSFHSASGSFKIEFGAKGVEPSSSDLNALEKELTAYAKRSGFSSFIAVLHENDDGSRELVLMPASKSPTAAALGDMVADIDTADGTWKNELVKSVAPRATAALATGIERPKNKGSKSKKR